MITKCANITNCDVYGKTVIYSAKSCKSNEQFTYNGSKGTLPVQPGEDWQCPRNNYAKIEYDPTQCTRNGQCEAYDIELVKDINYVQEHCWT